MHDKNKKKKTPVEHGALIAVGHTYKFTISIHLVCKIKYIWIAVHINLRKKITRWIRVFVVKERGAENTSKGNCCINLCLQHIHIFYYITIIMEIGTWVYFIWNASAVFCEVCIVVQSVPRKGLFGGSIVDQDGFDQFRLDFYNKNL